ncbi:MAG TPA: hypothetical protein VF692_04665 [Pyrinomonadaceae bacterium]
MVSRKVIASRICDENSSFELTSTVIPDVSQTLEADLRSPLRKTLHGSKALSRKKSENLKLLPVARSTQEEAIKQFAQKQARPKSKSEGAELVIN